MRVFHTTMLPLIAFLSLFLMSITVGSAQDISSIPSTISYQGHLVQSDGASLPDGVYDITVHFYDGVTADYPLWSETHQVSLDNGLFSLALGSIVPFDLAFDRQYWLGISLNGEAEFPLRTPLTSSPYALRSAVADRVESGAVTAINGIEGPVKIVGAGSTVVSESDGVITIASLSDKELQGGPKVEIAPSSAQSTTRNKSLIHLNETGSGSPNLIEMEVGGSNKFVVENDGDVTITGKATAKKLVVTKTTKLGDGTGNDNFTVNPGNGTVSFSNARIQSVGDPTAAQDAATKSYVDNAVAGAGGSGGNEPLVTFAAGSASLTNNRVLTAGTGVSITDAGADNGAMTVAIGQDVSTSSSPSFANLQTSNNLSVGNDVVVENNTTVKNDLLVENDVTALNDIAVGNDLTVANDLTVNGTNVTLPAGSIDNTELANSSIGVSYGSGLSGDGSVALGGTLSIQNTGVTSASAGSGISLDQSTGDLTISNTGVLSVNGTANQVNASTVSGVVTLSTPQDIATASSPSFAGLTVSGAVAAGSVSGDGSGLTNISGGALQAGSVANSALANSSISVSYGSGLSGDASVALGGTLAVQNTGVTSATAGSGISLDQSTGDLTISNTGILSVNGTTDQINASTVSGVVTLSTPQDIATTSSPSFAGLTLSSMPSNSSSTEVVVSNSGVLETVDIDDIVPPTDWSRSGNAGTTPGTEFLGTTDAQALHVKVNNATTMVFNTNTSLQRVATGNARGTGAIDLQSSSASAAQVASGNFAFIGSGNNNTASGIRSFLGSGFQNSVSGENAFLGSGFVNNVMGLRSFVGSGFGNVVIGGDAVIGGGFVNRVDGQKGVIAGGEQNNAAGDHTAIPGGRGLTLDASADRSFGFLGGNSGSNNMTISTPDVAVFGNTDLWLANNNSSASELRFYEPKSGAGAFPGGANYTAFRAGAQSADITYTLPTADGTNGQVLSTNGGGTLSWTTQAANVLQLNRVTTSANYTVTATDAIVGVDVSAGPVTITLPAANAFADGQTLIINVEAGNAATNNVTINAAGTDTIDGGTSVSITFGSGQQRIYSDGAGAWYAY